MAKRKTEKPKEEPVAEEQKVEVPAEAPVETPPAEAPEPEVKQEPPKPETITVNKFDLYYLCFGMVRGKVPHANNPQATKRRMMAFLGATNMKEVQAKWDEVQAFVRSHQK